MQNQAKSALRKQIKGRIQQITSSNKRRQSQIIAEKVFKLSEYVKAKRISIYLSMENEVNTRSILKKMFAQNKEVFVPTYVRKEMEMLRLYDMNDYENLPITRWNIKQPNIDDTYRENPMLTGSLDLILLPGLAFTLDGGRLGHGMGYYDKYLHRYFNKYPDKMKINKTFLVGLGFQEQIVDVKQLPLDPFDYPLDMILTCD